MNHGSKVAHVLIMKAIYFNIVFAPYRQIDEVARLVQTVEPLLLNDSAEQLIGDLYKGQLSRMLRHQQPWHGHLIPPSADFWLVQVIDEDGHGLPNGWTKSVSHPLVHRCLNGLLKDLWGCRCGEVALLVESFLGVVASGESIEDARLGGSLLSRQKDIAAQP